MLRNAVLSLNDSEDPNMDRQKVKSSLLKSVGYDEQALILEVEFENSEVQRFINIPKQTYDNLMKAPSVGGFFLQNINNQFSNRVIKVRKRKFAIL